MSTLLALLPVKMADRFVTVEAGILDREVKHKITVPIAINIGRMTVVDRTGTTAIGDNIPAPKR